MAASAPCLVGSARKAGRPPAQRISLVSVSGIGMLEPAAVLRREMILRSNGKSYHLLRTGLPTEQGNGAMRPLVPALAVICLLGMPIVDRLHAQPGNPGPGGGGTASQTFSFSVCNLSTSPKIYVAVIS